MMQDLLVTVLALAAAAAVLWRVLRSGRSGSSGQGQPSCPNCPGYDAAKPQRGGKGKDRGGLFDGKPSQEKAAEVVLPPDAGIV